MIVIIYLFLQCIDGIVTEQYVTECPADHFKLDEMGSCHPWITCEDVSSLTIIKHLDTGAVKDVYLIDWKNISIVLSKPINPDYIDDFLSGVKVLQLLNPSPFIVKFLGYCEKDLFLFTEFHLFGSAADFFKQLAVENNSIEGLNHCHQYSLILNHIHNGPAGRRVFCDSNSLEKLLSQLLITKDLKLILNDVDALPEVVDSSGIKCGHRRLEGTFVAPEQLWTKDDNFDNNLMPGYDEKTDVWKAAAVCDFFLKRSRNEVARYRLFDLHTRCRSQDPLLRPSADELVKEYQNVIEELTSHSEL